MASDTTIIGSSQSVRSMREVLERVAASSTTVLIEGETGSGKEVAARYIHEVSRARGSFVPLNCGAISPELIESELFGHAKGAFTGATSAREGLFVFANDGTLFLDEISEMSLPMQSQLLRVLEEKTVRPVGSDSETMVNTRVIAATNRHLAEEVAAGRFRQDLYYRLNVLTVRVPPLRERLEDIAELARHFIEELSRELGVHPVTLNHDQMSMLRNYTWRGNVRELKNILERYLLLGKFPALEAVAEDESVNHGRSIGFPAAWSLEKVEQHHVRSVLIDTGGNKAEAARRLGISRKTLDRKLRQWENISIADT